jgi:hypothetical protein
METTDDTIQRASDTFSMMVGYCIAQWASVEDILFLICHHALSCPRPQAAVVYYRTPQLDARFTLVSDLLSFILPQTESGGAKHDDVKEWDSIEKHFKNNLLPVRNRIAHHPVGMRYEAISSLHVSRDVHIDSWFHIYESSQERLRGRPPKSELLIGDLRNHLMATAKAKARLYQFHHERLIKHVQAQFPQ